MNNIVPKSRRGGKRPGAGRKPGSRDLATSTEVVNLAALAKSHAPTAVETLVSIMRDGQSEAARVSAATQILDRGFGRPAQTAESAVGEIHIHISEQMRRLG
jgi:hypothetical protein